MRPIQLIDRHRAARRRWCAPRNTVVCQPRNTPNMSAIARTKHRQRRSPTAIQKRRVMSTSSGFGPSSAEMVIGSSAIPHFGQAPGPCWTISGMHGTRVERVARRRRRLLRARLQEGLGVRLEPCQARRVAEVVAGALIVVRSRSGRRIDGHAADGIYGHWWSPARSSRIGQSGRRSPWQCCTS